jgi:hypothetical protein|nr:hypothetical protein [Kofleriaceae bacterium]
MAKATTAGSGSATSGAASRAGVRLGDTIDVIAKQMDRLAAATGRGAPRIELAPDFGGTIVRYRRKKHRIPEDGWAIAPCLAALGRLFDELGWPWRFAMVDDRLVLQPVAGAPGGAAAELPRILPLDELVGEARLYVGDSECVDAARDYEPLVRELARVTGGALAVSAVTCTQAGDTRALVVEAGGRVARATLHGGDVVDVPPLLACLNELLAGGGRLYAVREGGWRQELGVAFADDEVAADLERCGYLEV